MRPALLHLLPWLLLAVTGAAQVAPGANLPETLRKIAARYALTDQRIAFLVEQRRNPAPLPEKLPNPFAAVPDIPATDTATGHAAIVEAAVVPTASEDEPDEAILPKIAASLRIGGLVVLNGQPRLTINSAVCKVGDILPIAAKGRTLYVQVAALTPEELTLVLNEARHTIRLKR